MTAPLVSVVIPAYNAARTLPATIESVLAQTFRPIEVLLVDDGSTDDTASIAKSFGDSLRYLWRPNAGDVAARNTGIRSSTGTYVSLLDADDLWLPDKLARQIQMMEGDPTIGATQCSALFVDDSLRTLEVRRCRDGVADLIDVLRFRGLPAISSSLTVRRHCLERIGFIDATVSGKDEWDLAIKLARSCRFAGIDEPLVLRRVHGTSMTRQARYADKQVRAGSEILRRLFRDPTLPKHARESRREVYAAFFLMLAGSYLQARVPTSAISWSIRAILMNPRQLVYVAVTPFRRLRRKWMPER